MKKNSLILLVTLFVFACNANAAVFTVSNSPLSGGQYTDIQSAITAAAVDDTVYVNGSAITYPNATVNKRIVLIGAGYAVTGTQYNVPSTVGILYIDSVAFGSPVNGAHIIGFSANISCSITTTNIHIERCQGYIYGASGEGWIIENCVITSYLYFLNSPNMSNRIVRNNFIVGYVTSNYNSNAPGLIMDHNIIEGQITSINYAVITNNIFFFANIAASSNNNYNNYGNNITVYGTPDVIPFGTNTGSGNFNNVVPSTLFQGAASASQSFPALLNYDWHVLATSVGHLAGSDTTDIGIYGGASPMPNLTGASTLPQMTLMNINNASIPLNGTINYQFKARKQN